MEWLYAHPVNCSFSEPYIQYTGAGVSVVVWRNTLSALTGAATSLTIQWRLAKHGFTWKTQHKWKLTNFHFEKISNQIKKEKNKNLIKDILLCRQVSKIILYLLPKNWPHTTVISSNNSAWVGIMWHPNWVPDHLTSSTSPKQIHGHPHSFISILLYAAKSGLGRTGEVLNTTTIITGNIRRELHPVLVTYSTVHCWLFTCTPIMG